MNTSAYDKVIVGGGVAGLSAAYEIMTAAKFVGRPVKLAVLTDRISAPSAAGTHLLLGFDGFELDQLPNHAEAACDLVKLGLQRIGDIVNRHKIDCRYDLYYQLIAPEARLNFEMAAFHTARHKYRDGAFQELGNPSCQVRLNGFRHSLESTEIGQINGPEFLKGLTQVIREMGAEVAENASYKSHLQSGPNTIVQTSQGQLVTSSPILLAGGAHLMSKMPGLPVPITPIYTIAAHVSLSPAQAKQICSRPVAFFSSTKSYLWGSLDDKNVLTFGHGVCESSDGRQGLEANIRATFYRILPNLAMHLSGQLTFSFDAMACTSNQLPIVGRLRHYDVLTGNCGRGFAQSFAESHAYADWFINGNDTSLRLFESFNSSIS